ncbi:beta-2-microglobulin [Colius striatus]|uniref:beta-2-microglobulin n=1 Tax=Colius striatus TaxID=57412 RepID=UPI002B1D2597|nr:beta-2-microglobulin [Colius striatus]
MMERAPKVGVVVLIALFSVVGLGMADVISPEAPKVEVYSRNRAVLGEENVLNCFVSGFHPPKIDITLIKNGEPMSNVQYADMSFNDKWYFQRLVHAPFTPKAGDIYICRVAHAAFPEPQSFQWDADL